MLNMEDGNFECSEETFMNNVKKFKKSGKQISFPD